MITEEMVKKAANAWCNIVAHNTDLLADWNAIRARAALEAVAPMVRNAALEEAAKVAKQFTAKRRAARPVEQVSDLVKAINHASDTTAQHIASAIRALATLDQDKKMVETK